MVYTVLVPQGPQKNRDREQNVLGQVK